MKYANFLRTAPTTGIPGEAILVARALDGQMIEFSGFSCVHDAEGKLVMIQLQEKP